MTSIMQYWERKCGHHTSNMMACGACDKCLDCCDCSKGNIELFEALARNKLKRAQDAMLEKLNVPRQDKSREGGQTASGASVTGRTRTKKKFSVGRNIGRGI